MSDPQTIRHGHGTAVVIPLATGAVASTPEPSPAPYGLSDQCSVCGAALTAHAHQAVGVCLACVETTSSKVVMIPWPRYGSHLEIGFPEEEAPEA